MSNEFTPEPRADFEARLTALLLGELTGAEAAALRQQIEADPQLAALYERLKKTVVLVREAAARPVETVSAKAAPLKLSEDRRQKLLAQFKTFKPKEFAKPKQRPTTRVRLLELAAVFAILALLAGLLLPALSKAKSKSVRGSIASNLKQIELAKQMWAEDNKKSANDTPTSKDLEPYLGRGPQGMPSVKNERYIFGPVGQSPVAVLPGSKPRVYTLDDQANVGQLASTGLEQNGVLIARPKSDITFQNGAPSVLRSARERQETPNPSAAPAPAPQQLAQNNQQQVYLPNSRLLDEATVPPPQSSSDRLARGASNVGDPEWLGLLNQPAARNSNNQFIARYDFGVNHSWDDLSKPEVLTESGHASGVPESSVQQTAEPASPAASGQNGPGLYYVTSRNTDDGSGKGHRGTSNSAAPTYKAGTFAALSETTNALTESFDSSAERKLGYGNARPTEPGQAIAQTDPEMHSVVRMADAATLQSVEKITKDKPVPESNEIYKLNVVGYVNVSVGTNYQQPAEAPTTPVGGLKDPALVAQTQAGTEQFPRELSKADEGIARKKTELDILSRASESNRTQNADLPLAKPAAPAPVPQPEVATSTNSFSTFSLNIADVSFKLAQASLEKGVMPEPASIRSEEFINAFDYRDPEAPPGMPIAFAWERARYPFAQNRDLLRFSLKTAASGRAPGRALNIVLLLDNSGSMERADRVRIIHEALRVLAGQLQPQDTLSIVTFARAPRLFVDGVSGSQSADAVEKVSGLTPEGGTNLEDALKLAYETALRHYLANGINRVVLLTDGAANLGNVDPAALKRAVETHRKQGVALDCFGIGWEGYNDDLLEVLARNGDGRYGFLNSPEEAAEGFGHQLAGALNVAASDVKVQVEFNPRRVTAYRQIGYAKLQLTKEQFRDNTVDAAQIGAEEAGNALYVLQANPNGDGPLCTVRVRYRVPGTQDFHEHEWSVPYTGNAVPLEQASPAMRLAATASAFSEWLANSPYAAEVTPDALLRYLSGVPEIYAPDARPQKLEWMLRQAKSISGR